MEIFSRSSLEGYLKEKEQAMNEAIGSFGYQRLKEFKEEDFQSIVTPYIVEEIDADFDSAYPETTWIGEMLVGNPNQVFTHESLPPIRKPAVYARFRAQVKKGFDAIQYKRANDSDDLLLPFRDTNYERMSLSQEGPAILVEIFLPQSEIDDASGSVLKEMFKKEFLEYIKGTREYIKRSNVVIRDYNDSLIQIAKKTVNDEVKRGLALARVNDALRIEVRPNNRWQEKGKRIEVLPKKADVLLSERKRYDGYYLDKDNFDAIIQTIELYLGSTEEHPVPVQRLDDEECIRDMVIWALNANYFVTKGEAFRAKGKTDILIEFNDRSAFVAECKIWRGEESASKAIDQLFGYTTWRDSKAAILVFNTKNQDFALVCSRLREIVLNHPKFLRFSQEKSPRCFRCLFVDPNNEESSVEIAFIAANYVSRS